MTSRGGAGATISDEDCSDLIVTDSPLAIPRERMHLWLSVLVGASERVHARSNDMLMVMWRAVCCLVQIVKVNMGASTLSTLLSTVQINYNKHVDDIYIGSIDGYSNVKANNLFLRATRYRRLLLHLG